MINELINIAYPVQQAILKYARYALISQSLTKTRMTLEFTITLNWLFVNKEHKFIDGTYWDEIKPSKIKHRVKYHPRFDKRQPTSYWFPYFNSLRLRMEIDTDLI